MQDTVVLVQKRIDETSGMHVYNALSSPSFRKQVHIPDLKQKKLEPKLKARIDKICCEIHKEKKSATLENMVLSLTLLPRNIKHHLLK
jgi:hypothetical protein